MGASVSAASGINCQCCCAANEPGDATSSREMTAPARHGGSVNPYATSEEGYIESVQAKAGGSSSSSQACHAPQEESAQPAGACGPNGSGEVECADREGTAETQVTDRGGCFSNVTVDFSELAYNKPKRGSRMSSNSGPRLTKRLSQQMLKVARPRRSSRISAGSRQQYSNPNFPRDYRWLHEVLETVVRNRANALGCSDTSTGKGYDPVFFVMGACPNLFCGMQVVMYAVSCEGDCEVDFWWVKPTKRVSTSSGVTSSDANEGVEEMTLSRNNKGPHKNDPGRSRNVYKPLADLFLDAGVKDGMRFGIESLSGTDGDRSRSAKRAFIEQASDTAVGRFYIHLVWQEEWTSNPLARTKYIRGKFAYQKDPYKMEFHARQYSITNGSMSISDVEEELYDAILPGEEIKQLSADCAPSA